MGDARGWGEEEAQEVMTIILLLMASLTRDIKTLGKEVAKLDHETKPERSSNHLTSVQSRSCGKILFISESMGSSCQQKRCAMSWSPFCEYCILPSIVNFISRSKKGNLWGSLGKPTYSNIFVSRSTPSKGFWRNQLLGFNHETNLGGWFSSLPNILTCNHNNLSATLANAYGDEMQRHWPNRVWI